MNSDGNIDMAAKDVDYLTKDSKAFYKKDESFLESISKITRMDSYGLVWTRMEQKNMKIAI